MWVVHFENVQLDLLVHPQRGRLEDSRVGGEVLPQNPFKSIDRSVSVFGADDHFPKARKIGWITRFGIKKSHRQPAGGVRIARFVANPSRNSIELAGRLRLGDGGKQRIVIQAAVSILLTQFSSTLLKLLFSSQRGDKLPECSFRHFANFITAILS